MATFPSIVGRGTYRTYHILYSGATYYYYKYCAVWSTSFFELQLRCDNTERLQEDSRYFKLSTLMSDEFFLKNDRSHHSPHPQNFKFNVSTQTVVA